MLVPETHIIITALDGKVYEFDYIIEGEIERNFEKITQTAKFSIPNNYGFTNITNSLRSDNKKVTDIIKKGSKVSIKLRFLYNDIEDRANRQINPEIERFTGYITKIKPGYIVQFECEDEMWKLKQTVFQAFQLNSPVTLNSLISYMQKQTGLTFNTNISDTSDLGTIQVTSGNTFADVLDFIKQKYLFLAYFKTVNGNPTLTMRKGDQFKDGITKKFTFNGPDANITDKGSLEWQYIDDIKLMIKFTKQVIQTGQADKKTTIYVFRNVKGEIINKNTPEQGYNQIEHLTTSDISNGEMVKQATSLLNSLTYTGYKGDFSTFGEPVMDFGDKVNIINQRYPELSSNGLLIRAVKTTFGTKGYFQNLSIYGQ